MERLWQKLSAPIVDDRKQVTDIHDAILVHIGDAGRWTRSGTGPPCVDDAEQISDVHNAIIVYIAGFLDFLDITANFKVRMNVRRKSNADERVFLDDSLRDNVGQNSVLKRQEKLVLAKTMQLQLWEQIDENRAVLTIADPNIFDHIGFDAADDDGKRGHVVDVQCIQFQD